MVRLYHYTDAGSLESIKQQRLIRKSSRSQHHTDMIFGEGVYLTSMDPESYDKEELAKNNWLGGGPSRMAQGKTDHHVWIEIPENDPRQEECQARGRDVWLFK